MLLKMHGIKKHFVENYRKYENMLSKGLLTYQFFKARTKYF
jgi:hypothetical protein